VLLSQFYFGFAVANQRNTVNDSNIAGGISPVI
jgi:hypothetical protein